MKKLLLGLLSLAGVLLLSSCGDDEVSSVNEREGYANVRFSVTGMQVSQVPMRSSLSEAFSMLEVVLYTVNEDGTYTKYREVDQVSTNAAFGVINMDNVKYGNYKVVVLGHNDSAHPDLDDPTDIVFTNYPNACSYSTDLTVSTKDPQVDIEMSHISTRIRFQITGYIPDAVEKLLFTVDGASNNLDAITGLAKTTGTREIRFDVTEKHKSDQNLTISMYTFIKSNKLTEEDSYVNISLAGLDAGGNQIDAQTYQKVPLMRGYITNFSGTFFRYGTLSFNITVDNTWDTYTNVSF